MPHIFVECDVDFILVVLNRELLNFNLIIYGQTGEDGKIVSEEYEAMNHKCMFILPFKIHLRITYTKKSLIEEMEISIF